MNPKCPFCDKEQKQKPLKTWQYSKTVAVSQYICRCSGRFRFYKGDKNSWTIPKKKE
jgi:hypothetical protein